MWPQHCDVIIYLFIIKRDPLKKGLDPQGFGRWVTMQVNFVAVRTLGGPQKDNNYSCKNHIEALLN